jgi:hypothetical protein
MTTKQRKTYNMIMNGKKKQLDKGAMLLKKRKTIKKMSKAFGKKNVGS